MENYKTNFNKTMDELKTNFNKTMDELKTNFNKTMDELNKINDILLNPDTFIWGKMSKEEADNYFNDPTSDMYDDWGCKSMNMLLYINDEKNMEYTSEEEEPSLEEIMGENYCSGGRH